MDIGLILDAVVILVLIGALWTGIARGLLRTLGTVIGLIAGGAAALVVMPFVSRAVPATGWNVVAAIGVGVVCIVLGAGIGGAIGRVFRRGARTLKLGPIDRIAGGAAGLAVAVATALILAMSVSSFGVPALSQAVASSQVLRFLQSATPEPVQRVLAQARSAALDDGIPTLLEAAGIQSTGVPDAATNTEALDAASRSVLRISTNSPACNTASTGSGFVIADELVMTNAHVVSGSQEVVVEERGAFPHAANVVYYDADADIAVLRVPAVQAPPLSVGADPDAGQTVFFQGYPYGGPFVASGASALVTGPMLAPSVAGTGTATRSVTTIAGDVNPGNSGGPLLDADGTVIGMIFAKSDTSTDIGFALAMAELAPVLASADALTQPVATGRCAA